MHACAAPNAPWRPLPARRRTCADAPRPWPLQGRVLEIVQQTWARGGVFAFFSGNEAGALARTLRRPLRAARLPCAAAPPPAHDICLSGVSRSPCLCRRRWAWTQQVRLGALRQNDWL